MSNAFEILRDPGSAEAVTRWFHPNGYGMLRRLSVTHNVSGQIPLAPVVRLLESGTSLLLVAENPTSAPVSISAEFVQPQNFGPAEDDSRTLRLILAPESGHVAVWKKNNVSDVV